MDAAGDFGRTVAESDDARSVMSSWWREAHTGAAREFGARHYRKFAALELVGVAARPLRKLAAPLAILANVTALVWRPPLWVTDSSAGVVPTELPW
jgi:hypothetical protein